MIKSYNYYLSMDVTIYRPNNAKVNALLVSEGPFKTNILLFNIILIYI